MSINLTKEQHELLNTCFKFSYETLEAFINNDASVAEMGDDLLKFGKDWLTIKEKLRDLILVCNKKSD